MEPGLALQALRNSRARTAPVPRRVPGGRVWGLYPRLTGLLSPPSPRSWGFIGAVGREMLDEMVGIPEMGEAARGGDCPLGRWR